jgi:hypothetical protein
MLNGAPSGRIYPDHKAATLVENNKAMLQFLSKKLGYRYNVFCALNGAEALKKLPQLPAVTQPDYLQHYYGQDGRDCFCQSHPGANQL